MIVPRPFAIGLGTRRNQSGGETTYTWAMAELGEIVLQVLEERGSVDSYELSRELKKDHQAVVGAVKSLQTHGDVRSRAMREITCPEGCSSYDTYIALARH